MCWSLVKARYRCKSPEEDLGILFSIKFPYVALSTRVGKCLGRKLSLDLESETVLPGTGEFCCLQSQSLGSAPQKYEAGMVWTWILGKKATLLGAGIRPAEQIVSVEGDVSVLHGTCLRHALHREG